MENDPTLDKLEANARLIAAAPELFNLLKILKNQVLLANNRQHAKLKILPEMWGDLYSTCQRATALIYKIEH